MFKRRNTLTKMSLAIIITLLITGFTRELSKNWTSRFIQMDKDGHLQYNPDKLGNTIPDFSKVGYRQGDHSIPFVKAVITLKAPASGYSDRLIQDAIDAIAGKAPDPAGFRGAILLEAGTYKLQKTLQIRTSGIVLRGESSIKETNDSTFPGQTEILEGSKTKLIATTTKQSTLINVSGTGHIREIPGSRIKIQADYVPVGATTLNLASTKGLKPGDSIIVFRPGTNAWITDLKMDRIVARKGTKQWQAKEYDFQFERIITQVKDHSITIDNPIVMAMETKYGGGSVYRYTYSGRISNVGIEGLALKSAFTSDTAEQHGWNAIRYDHIENGWVRNVSAQYFGYSCVNLGYGARNITVLNCQCYDAKSIITGGRRYSFNNDGQLNLFMHCQTTEGRHDYVTGAKVCGPNVFVNCKATNTHADIGPHHRWAMGTLYDQVQTTGEINIQDRGNWGSGHGWSGINQILWNCQAKAVVVQDPWVSGHNYCIGLQGQVGKPRLKERNQGIWEGLNHPGLLPSSLYMAQLKDRHRREQTHS